MNINRILLSLFFCATAPLVASFQEHGVRAEETLLFEKAWKKTEKESKFVRCIRCIPYILGLIIVYEGVRYMRIPHVNLKTSGEIKKNTPIPGVGRLSIKFLSHGSGGGRDSGGGGDSGGGRALVDQETQDYIRSCNRHRGLEPPLTN